MTHIRTALMLLAVASAASAETPTAEPISEADVAVYRRIDKVRRAATHLRLDGMDRDWREVPRFSDPRGDAGGDARRDIISIAMAATETDLWLMVRTLNTPVADRWLYYFAVDMFGEYGDDFQISVEQLGQPPSIRVFDRQVRPGPPIPLRRSQVAVRQVVEMRISYRDIAEAMPDERSKLVAGDGARSWVRIRSQTWNSRQRQSADWAPVMAGFRLRETPYPLDRPLPPRPTAPLDLSMPLQGEWFVLQGPFGSRSHSGIWAYDLVRLDRHGHESRPRQSGNNADYFAWDQPIVAPQDAVVSQARDDSEDSPARRSLDHRGQGNRVMLRLSNTATLGLGHMREGSVDVARGDRVSAGQTIGRVGNSGLSYAPHLHIALWRGRFGIATAPLALKNVRVGLNPGANDPWARNLASWEPRVGYFVESTAGKARGE